MILNQVSLTMRDTQRGSDEASARVYFVPKTIIISKSLNSFSATDLKGNDRSTVEVRACGATEDGTLKPYFRF